jgi:hypothetical protein
MSTPKLEKTIDYSIFQPHECNHDLMEKPTLLESMKRYGFMPSGAIHCVTLGKGMLKVIRGHHRLMYAKRLGLPVYYIVDNACPDIFFLEAIEKQQWSCDGFVQAYAKSGNPYYCRIMAFSQEHGLSINISSSLLAGESAGSGNQAMKVKRGEFKTGDIDHAMEVVRITDCCRAMGVSFATSTSFVNAVSAVLRTSSINKDRLLAQIRKYAHMMHKRTTRDEYFEEIEIIYNYRSRSELIPVKMRAIEIMRARQMINKYNKKNQVSG